MPHPLIPPVAHVRGGGEMGRAWYEDGKLQKKKNTFTDFISAAEHLISLGWTDSSKLAISGERQAPFYSRVKLPQAFRRPSYPSVCVLPRFVSCCPFSPSFRRPHCLFVGLLPPLPIPLRR